MENAAHARAAQPLFEMCIALLVDHVDCIESLAGLPDVMRVKLAEAASACCKLEPEVRSCVLGMHRMGAPTFAQGAARSVLHARAGGEGHVFVYGFLGACGCAVRQAHKSCLLSDALCARHTNHAYCHMRCAPGTQIMPTVICAGWYHAHCQASCPLPGIMCSALYSPAPQV